MAMRFITLTANSPEPDRPPTVMIYELPSGKFEVHTTAQTGEKEVAFGTTEKIEGGLMRAKEAAAGLAEKIGATEVYLRVSQGTE